MIKLGKKYKVVKCSDHENEYKNCCVGIKVTFDMNQDRFPYISENSCPTCNHSVWGIDELIPFKETRGRKKKCDHVVNLLPWKIAKDNGEKVECINCNELVDPISLSNDWLFDKPQNNMTLENILLKYKTSSISLTQAIKLINKL